MFIALLCVAFTLAEQRGQGTAWSSFKPSAAPGGLSEQAELAKVLDADNAHIQVLGFKSEKQKLQAEIARLQAEVAGMTPQNAAQATSAMEKQDANAQADLATLNARAESAEQRMQQQAALQSMWQATESEQAAEQARERAEAAQQHTPPPRFRQPHQQRQWASRPPHGAPPAPPPPPHSGSSHGMLILLVVGCGGYFLYKKQEAATRHMGYGEINSGSTFSATPPATATVVPSSPAGATSGSSDGPGL